MTMFRLIEQENNSYFLVIKINEIETTVNITDLKNIWQVKLYIEEIVERFKIDNPFIQSSDKWIAEHIKKVINTDSNNEVKCIKLNEGEIKITIISNESGIPIKINFHLKKQSLEMIYNEITLPLLMLCNELKFSKEKLIKIVKAKDVEIKEFKFEGATITRKNAITEPFNEEKFDSECHSNFQARAKESISRPCSIIYPTLTPFYDDFSSVVSSANIKKENIINESITEPIKDNKSRSSELICTNDIRNASNADLKRKISESMCRTKRHKKSYKI